MAQSHCPFSYFRIYRGCSRPFLCPSHIFQSLMASLTIPLPEGVKDEGSSPHTTI